jgi:hypothetical protein
MSTKMVYLLPNGLTLILRVFEGPAPSLEPGFKRVASGVHWCLDEEIFGGAL